MKTEGMTTLKTFGFLMSSLVTPTPEKSEPANLSEAFNIHVGPKQEQCQGQLRSLKNGTADHYPPPNSKSFSQRYLIGFTTVFYYICLLPFRLTLVGSIGNPDGILVERHRNVFQRVLCIFIHVILLSNICCFASLSKSGAVPLLEASKYLEYCTLTFCYLYIVWCAPHHFDWLLRSTSKHEASGGVIQVKSDSIPILEMFQNGFSLFLLIGLFMVSAYINSDGEIDLANYPSLLLLLQDNLGEDGLGGQLGSIVYHVWDHIIDIAYNVDGIIFQAVAFVYRDRVQQFIRLMECQVEVEIQVHQFGVKRNNKGQPPRPTEESSSLVMHKFLELEHFVNGVNERFGGFILIAVMSNIPHFAEALALLLKGKESVLGVVSLVFYVGFIFFWMFTAARLSTRVSNIMKNWLQQVENHSTLPTNQMLLLMSKVNPEGVALRGGNFFAITYPFIGTLVSLIITYTFIDQRN